MNINYTRPESNTGIVRLKIVDHFFCSGDGNKTRVMKFRLKYSNG